MTEVVPPIAPEVTSLAGVTNWGDQEPLGRLVKRGFGWGFSGNVVGRMLSVVTGIALARILSPSDYGHFTVALVALVVVVNINDLGLEPTVVRWKGNLAEVAPTATTLIFLSSCGLFSLFYAGAPFFANLLNAPEATGMVRLLAFGVVINGAFAVPSAMLTRSFRQDRRAVADFIGLFVTSGLTILLALLGWGAWSLAWGRVVGNGVNGVLHLILAPVRFRPGWSPTVARSLLASSLPLAGTSLLAVAVVNVDYIVVGRVLGPVALGLYLLAFNLSSWPVTMLSTAVAQVAIPAFARLQEQQEELERAFSRALALLMAASVPAAALVATFALPLVRVVYGSRWTAAALPLGFLAVLGGIRVALHLASDLLVAVGRGRATLGLQSLWLALLVPALALGAHLDGIRGVGVAHIVVASLFMVPAFLRVLKRLGLHARPLLASTLRPVTASLAASAVGVAALQLVSGDLAQLLLGGTGALLAYAALIAPARHELRRAVR